MRKTGNILAWGISCKVRNEEKMGTALAALSMLDAFDIAWAPIREKDPVAVESGKKGAAAKHAKAKGKKGGGPTGRTPAREIATKFLAQQTGQFQAKALSDVLKAGGYSATGAYPMLNEWLKSKVIRRVSAGKYQPIQAVKVA